jgi:ribonuclease Y
MDFNIILPIIIGVVSLIAGISAGKILFAKNTRLQIEEADLQSKKIL